MPRSIAVLPFVNMSTDAENEFFSDGLSEEILNSLARIDGMQVVGRTSSFQFKGKNDDLRTIGEKLGVATVLEGSVRREGDRARITAQLIRTSDGIHLWSQTYDRTLKDTLAVQLDIAEQVAGALERGAGRQAARAHARCRREECRRLHRLPEGLEALRRCAHRKPELDLIDGLRLANVEFDKAIALEPDFSFAYFAEADLYEHILLADDRSQAERARCAAFRAAQPRAGGRTQPDEQQRALDAGRAAVAQRRLARIVAIASTPRCDSPAAARRTGCRSSPAPSATATSSRISARA